MRPALLLLLALVAAAPARAQDDEGGGDAPEQPSAISADRAAPSESAQAPAVHDTDPTANPEGGNPDCSGPPLPEGRFKIAYPNGWFPKVSPSGEWIAYGFGDVSVVNVRSRSEKLLRKGDSFPDGWIRGGTLRYLHSTGHTTADAYTAAAPGFSPKKTKDEPGLAAGNQHASNDGHWASWLAAGGRVAYDGKVLTTGAGGVLDTSAGWVAHAADGEHSKIALWKKGKRLADRPVQVPLLELSMRNGFIAYGGYGPLRGIDPSGRDINLAVVPQGWKEGQPKVFIVRTGERRGAWVASAMCDEAGWDKEHKGKCLTMLRPWGQARGVVLEGGASGMSVVERCGSIVVARNDDKGRMKVDVLRVPGGGETFAQALAASEALKKGGTSIVGAALDRIGSNGNLPSD